MLVALFRVVADQCQVEMFTLLLKSEGLCQKMHKKVSLEEDIGLKSEHEQACVGKLKLLLVLSFRSFSFLYKPRKTVMTVNDCVPPRRFPRVR